MKADTAELEEAYAESIKKPLDEARKIGNADIAVGILLQNDAGKTTHIFWKTAKAITTLFPGKKCVLICVGNPDSKKTLAAIQEAPLERGVKKIVFSIDDKRISGKAWRLRAMMQLVQNLNADMAFLEIHLNNRKQRNEIEDSILEILHHLLMPIENEGIDLVIPRFSYNYFDVPDFNHLVRPLLASIFNLKVGGLPNQVFGASSKLIGIYLNILNDQCSQIGDQGTGTWLITTAAINNAMICESDTGWENHQAGLDKESVWRQQTEVIFQQVAAYEEWWQQRGDLLYPLEICRDRITHWPQPVDIDTNKLVNSFKHGYNEFEGLYAEVLSREVSVELRKLSGSEVEHFVFPLHLWPNIVYDFLIAYCLKQEFNKNNLINAFSVLCHGREAGFLNELKTLEKQLTVSIPHEAERLTALVAEWEAERQSKEFIEQKLGFLVRWKEIEAARKPLLPRVTYREFIPGVPLIVPKELISFSGDIIRADDIYRDILNRYHNEFENFIYKRLKLLAKATYKEIAESIQNLMLQVEEDIDKVLLPGNLFTIDGTRKVGEAIFSNFPHYETFALIPEVTSWILHRNPPSHLLIKFGAASLAELENRYDPNDLLALSSLLEEPHHTASVWEWIAGNARSEHFGNITLEPLVVSCEDFPMFSMLKETSTLSKLAGRVIVGNLPEGTGGQFPKLRYFTTIAKNIIEAEMFGKVWEQFARERKEFGTRVVNSLKGHWGREPLSAHNMFENKIQRLLINRLRGMNRDWHEQHDPSLSRLVCGLNHVVDCYHLAFSVPDGTFIPCSAWTWASYSYKGGTGIPTPLSLHVERDWTSREFLVELVKALGGNEESIDRKITELMGQGKESENLAMAILPGWSTVQEVVPEQLPRTAEPEAEKLSRFPGNPILRVIPEHAWESKYVFNPGVIRLDGKIYILYRACGEDQVSRIGLAISPDGFNIEERLENPVYEPVAEWERRGCEDPRLVLIGKRIYMTYTAYDSVVAQIALASITLKNFLNRRWDKWERCGLAFPGFEDKDATLFPQKFNGRYVLYHRIEPSIWISSFDRVECPWPREEHRILAGPGAGMAWDGLKIGGGSQPIKTKYGWLLIYHGVDYCWIYRLGVLLVALDDPGRIIYRSPNYILQPEAICELGEEGCYVPNVVFTCGAVPAVDKEIIDDDDEVLVYYGAADTAICVAKAKVSELIPEEIRLGRNHNAY